MTTTAEAENQATTTHSWEQRFDELADYLAQNSSYPSPNVPLGRWVSRQRTCHRRGQLDVERITKLETLPGWAWNLHEDLWAAQFARAVEYVAHHRTYPHNQKTELGRWLHSQRRDQSAGILPKARAAKLETLPGWSWEPHRTNWNLMYMQLADHFNGTDQYPPRGDILAAWIRNQRRVYHAGNLSTERVRLLESLPQWSWTPNPTHRNANGRFTRPVA